MKFMNLYFLMAAKKPVKKKKKTSKTLNKDENLLEPLIEKRFNHFKADFEKILKREGLIEPKVLKKIYQAHRYFIGTNLIFEKMITLEQDLPPKNMVLLSERYGDESKKRMARLRKEFEDGKYSAQDHKALSIYFERIDNLDKKDCWITGED